MCRLSSEDVVKIADASFSHDLYPDEYMELRDKPKPVRWMAPETLKQDYYGTKTGVVRWPFVLFTVVVVVVDAVNIVVIIDAVTEYLYNGLHYSYHVVLPLMDWR